MNPKGALVVATVTFGLDFVFHLAETSPMEVPIYFIAKFVVAFLIAYYLMQRIGLLKSAILFTVIFDIYYYVGVGVLGLSYLSASPTAIIPINGISNQAVLALVWTFVHGLFFYAGGLAGRAYGKGK